MAVVILLLLYYFCFFVIVVGFLYVCLLFLFLLLLFVVLVVDDDDAVSACAVGVGEGVNGGLHFAFSNNIQYAISDCQIAHAHDALIRFLLLNFSSNYGAVIDSCFLCAP